MSVVLKRNSKSVVGLNSIGDKMKRIDLIKFSVQKFDSLRQIDIAAGINEIMDFLEDFLEKKVSKRNGKIYKCKNCGHVTGYPGDLNCCKNPDFEVIT